MTSCIASEPSIREKQLLESVCLKSSSTLSNVELTLPNLPDEFLVLNYVNRDTIASEKNVQVTHMHNNVPFPLAQGSIFCAPIKEAMQLSTGDDVKQIFKFTLDLTNSEIEFEPGDTLGVIPCNQSTEVKTVLDRVCTEENTIANYELLIKDSSRKNVSIPLFIPTNSTVRHVLETCLDIRTIPKKLFLRVLAEYATDKDEKRRLQELCSRQGAKDYLKFILEDRTTFIDILVNFPSCSPPVNRLFEFLPRLQARPYSIASSPLSGSMAVIVFSVPLGQPQNSKGLCTNWMLSVSNIQLQEESLTQQLYDLKLGNGVKSKGRIHLFLRKSNGFSLPKDPTIPLILIGPGTGISPFIGFLQHRLLSLQASNIDRCGEIWLFSGCRYSDRDFVFRKEVEIFLECGVLSRFFMSFSREDQKVKFVQDNIKSHSKEFVVQLVDKKSQVFVCGDAKNMAADVWKTILSLLQTEKGMAEKDAAAFLENLKAEKKYKQDIWI